MGKFILFTYYRLDRSDSGHNKCSCISHLLDKISELQTLMCALLKWSYLPIWCWALSMENGSLDNLHGGGSVHFAEIYSTNDNALEYRTVLQDCDRFVDLVERTAHAKGKPFGIRAEPDALDKPITTTTPPLREHPPPRRGSRQQGSGPVVPSSDPPAVEGGRCSMGLRFFNGGAPKTIGGDCSSNIRFLQLACSDTRVPFTYSIGKECTLKLSCGSGRSQLPRVFFIIFTRRKLIQHKIVCGCVCTTLHHMNGLVQNHCFFSY
jgi:hypothetical protein